MQLFKASSFFGSLKVGCGPRSYYSGLISSVTRKKLLSKQYNWPNSHSTYSSIGANIGSPIPDERSKELDRWRNLDFSLDNDASDSYVSDSKIVIICGCGRSGTTLLRVLLDTHSQMSAGPESLLFLPTEINLESLSKKFGIDNQILREMYDSSESRMKFVDDFRKLYLQINKKEIWVDKTARNVHRISHILKHFPNAKIIHVVRDARDTISSLKQHKKRRIVDGKFEPTGFTMPLQNCIDRWLFAINDGIKFRNHPNYIEVKYEDIVLNTANSLKMLCGFMGVEFQQKMMSFYEVDSATRSVVHFYQNIEATRPISHKSVGRWQKDLTPEEIDQVVSQAGAIMRQIGYNPGKVSSTVVERNPFLPIPIMDALVLDEVLKDAAYIKEQVLRALKLFYEKKSFIRQPQKQYIQRSSEAVTSDRIISMPVYIDGDDGVAGIKWIGSNAGNHSFGMNRANAIIVLNDVETNAPMCIMDGTVISSMRTVAVSLIAIDKLLPKPKKVACIGMGKLGRMHVTLISNLYPSVEKIFCYGNNDYSDIVGEKVIRCSIWREAIENADVIISTTSVGSPYIKGSDINGNKLIINLSLMDFDIDVYKKSSAIIVDDWFQCSNAKKVFKQAVDRGIISREDVIELPDLLFGDKVCARKDGIIMVNALGMAIEDIIVAKAIYEKMMFMSGMKFKYFHVDNKLNPAIIPK